MMVEAMEAKNAKVWRDRGCKRELLDFDATRWYIRKVIIGV
jgi:hypothetical protein